MPAGTSSFTVRVADAAGQDDTQALSIVINLSDPPVITTTTLPGGTVGQAYNQTLQATGGIGILTWTLAGGSLPALLSLSPDGVLSGAPTTAGTSNFTVTVRDTLNQSDTQSLSIAVSAALTITTDSLPDAGVDLSPTIECCNAREVSRPLPGRSHRLYRTASAWRRRPVRLPAPRRQGRKERYAPYLHRAGFVDTDVANS